MLEIKNVWKTFNKGTVNEKQALCGVNLTLNDGDFCTVIGGNGAGKSTTINILCTVLEKTSGNVKIGGYDLDKEKNKIKELIGIVFQGSVLDKQLNVKENRERHITDSTKKKSPKELKALHKPLTFRKFSKENTAH